jgi:hypothetical protein
MDDRDECASMMQPAKVAQLEPFTIDIPEDDLRDLRAARQQRDSGRSAGRTARLGPVRRHRTILMQVDEVALLPCLADGAALLLCLADGAALLRPR